MFAHEPDIVVNGPFPSYYTLWHKLGAWSLQVGAWLVLFFLILPILVIVPLSFNAEPFFSSPKAC